MINNRTYSPNTLNTLVAKIDSLPRIRHTLNDLLNGALNSIIKAQKKGHKVEDIIDILKTMNIKCSKKTLDDFIQKNTQKKTNE